MNNHTDLAIEIRESYTEKCDGVSVSEYVNSGVTVTSINIMTEQGAANMRRPCGNYITLQTDAIMSHAAEEQDCIEVMKLELEKLMPKARSVLVCGIGNHNITPDALGPKAASMILATRHISQSLASEVGLGKLCPVCVVSPGVLGQTGMEIHEVLGGLVEKTHPDCVIVIDALAARSLDRLGCTIQLSDTGIIPGSGVHNARTEISKKTLCVPVISIGVPTVVDCRTLTENMSGSIDEKAAKMIVTPREIDTIIEHAATIVAMGINRTLQPHISIEDMAMLVS